MQTYISRDEYLGSAPEQASADTAHMSKLEAAVQDFNQYYEQLHDVRFGAAIGRMAGTPEGNQLNLDYGRELAKSNSMKRRIESVLGPWEKVKSMIGLGALPLIAIAGAVALAATIAAAVTTGRAFLKSANIKLAMQADPDLTYQDAAKQVTAADRSSYDRTLDLAQVGISLLVLWGVYRFFKD